jgi:antitoxin component YwqK of YwqJK toxin-antitoxin module
VRFYEDGKVREKVYYKDGKEVAGPVPYDAKGKDQRREQNLQKQIVRLNKWTVTAQKTVTSLGKLFKLW